MAGLELVVGGWFASAVIGKFINKASDYLVDNHGLDRETREILNNLKYTLPQMQAIMIEVEKQPIQNKGLIEWANLIKNAAYEAEDVLDGFAAKRICEDLKGQVKVSKAASSIAKGVKNSLLLNDDVRKLKAVVKNLEGLCQQSSTFIGLLKLDTDHKQKGPASTNSGEPTQILPLDQILGRDSEIKFILSMILGYEIESLECVTSSQDNNVDAGQSNTLDMGIELGKTEQITSSQEQGMDVGSKSSHIRTNHYGRPHVIPMVGICGVGKTFLAHTIYRHQLLKGRFHLKKWFYMSQVSDVEKMVKALVPSIDSSDPDDLRKQLDSKIEGKRFLLVLDDVRSEVCFNLDQHNKKRNLLDVLSRFNVGAYGSVILVTTREHNVSKILGTIDPIFLKPLEWNYFLPLLEYYAFQNVNITSEERQAIKKLCWNVGRKLHGIPQAAKMIGNMLRLKIDVKYWQNILYNLRFRYKNVFSFLEMAYQHLDANLKQCFAFCSVLPTNYIVDRDRIIQLWIANNFIQLNSPDEVRSEDMGEMWFNELVNMSFFLPTPWPHKYIVNSAMRELAVGISSNEVFIFDDNPMPNSCLHGCFLNKDDPNQCTHGYSVIDKCPRKIPPSTRYLTVTTTKPTIDLGACSDNLRTLLFRSDYYESPVNEQKKGWLGQFSRILKKDDHMQFASGSFLSSSGKLRVLELSCPDDGVGKQIAICELPHLRFLDLSYSGIRELPETICTLYHLQVLDIRGSKFEKLPVDEKIKKLPKKLNHLINLRHLYSSKQTVSLISNIGELTNLQELEEFRITMTEGHTISELAEMKEIGGHLSIVGLENVKDEVEACEARLAEKRYLKVVSLRWTEKHSEDTTNKDMEKANKILNSLEPNSAVEELEIENYQGTELPSWTTLALPNIRRIYLKSCHHLKDLPDLGQLPYLETLVLEDLTLKHIGEELYGPGPSIFPKLKVLKFLGMKKWETWSPSGERELLPGLEELEIRDCGELKMTPLRSLELYCLKKLELSRYMPFLYEESLSDKQLPLLSSLCISHNRCITLAYQNIPNLRVLSLQSSGVYFEGHRPGLSKLKSLILDGSCTVNWNTRKEPDLSSLTELMMKSGPDSFRNIIRPCLPSLRILEIRAFSPWHLNFLQKFFLDLPQLLELTLTLEGVLVDHAGFTLTSLISLKSLTIHFRGLIEFRSIPKMPPNLKELYIIDMPKKLMPRWIPFRGQDWRKIAHIPYIRVNGETLQML